MTNKHGDLGPGSMMDAFEPRDEVTAYIGARQQNRRIKEENKLIRAQFDKRTKEYRKAKVDDLLALKKY